MRHQRTGDRVEDRRKDERQFEALDIGVQRKVVEAAIGLFLQDLGDGLQAPNDPAASAADDAIAAFWHGEYDRALTCICAGESPTTPRGTSSTSSSARGAPSLRDLWRRFVFTYSLP